MLAHDIHKNLAAFTDRIVGFVKIYAVMYKISPLTFSSFNSYFRNKMEDSFDLPNKTQY